MAKDMYQKRKERQENKKNEQYEDKKTNINWYPGHMFKTKKQIIEDLRLIDVIIEILDARIPISSQNLDIREIIKDKKRIIVLNKSDLANELETHKWLNYFNNKAQTIAISANSNEGNFTKILIDKINCLMEEDLKKASNKGIINKNIRIMVLGIPNVR